MRDTISLPNNTSDENPAISAATEMAKASVGFYSAPALKAAAIACGSQASGTTQLQQLDIQLPTDPQVKCFLIVSQGKLWGKSQESAGVRREARIQTKVTRP